jgi:hypothetical protein
VITKFIEVTNVKDGGINFGKFLLLRYDESEWAVRSSVDGHGLLSGRGWTPKHLWVLDVQTGEGACYMPGGLASHDLNEKHKIWVCPMYEPFLTWLYRQDLTDITALPSLVELSEKDAPSSMAGHRRRGQACRP